jgi:hypothetical protein
METAFEKARNTLGEFWTGKLNRQTLPPQIKL